MKKLFFIFMLTSLFNSTTCVDQADDTADKVPVTPALKSPKNDESEKSLDNKRDQVNDIKIDKSVKVVSVTPFKTEELVPFTFKKEKLVNIIDLLAKKRGVNYILPQRAADAEDIKNQVITFTPKSKEVSFDVAWNLVTLFLELSGFSWFLKQEGLYEIVPTGRKPDSGIFKEPLPLYVGTKPEDLPKSDDRIRYVYYLANLTITEDKDNPLNQIFKDMSSDGSPDPIILTKANGFILVDKANAIASMITLISRLDSTGFREAIEIIPLYNVSAASIADVLETLKKAAGEERTSPFIRADTKASTSFFAADTQIVADTRNNSLILMGRQTAVERIKDFIKNHVDNPQDSGQSVLHYYDLQYLNAQEFAGILQDIVRSNLSSGDQATAARVGGPQRFFQGVVVMAEKIDDVQPIQGPLATEPVKTDSDQGFDAKGIQGYIKTGGNRLIIAALDDDWKRVRPLIASLDKPEPQVILEVIICDFTHNSIKEIASAFRNTQRTSLPNITQNGGLQFLSSNITPVNNVLGAQPTRLTQDLLAVVSGGTAATVASLIAPGSLLISANDIATAPTASDNQPGGIFTLLQVLDEYIDARVLSHPFLICTNNQKATVSQREIRRQRGDAIPSQSGVVTIQIEDVPASIQVQMIPRISSLQRLGLQIALDVNTFVSPTSFDRATRRVETNSYMQSGDILVVGGLTKITNNDSITETPILSQIPILGYLFKGVNRTVSISNIAIFISPTIISAKARSGLNLYTEDKIAKGRAEIDDNLVYGFTKDPITRLFFPNSKTTNDRLFKEYLDQTFNAKTYEELVGDSQKLPKRVALPLEKDVGKRPRSRECSQKPPLNKDQEVPPIIA